MLRALVAVAAATALSCLLGPAASAQEAQEGLRKKLDAKLAEAWVKDGAWITDYDAAREEARKSGKPIVAYFTRSYAH